jgi:hypothetical protein
MEIYRHKQVSMWPLLLLGVVALFSKKKPRRSLLTLCLALLTMQLFALKTRVDERGVSWNFGLSLPIGEIPFDEITDVQMTQTGMLEGFGIHWTPRLGWLWKVSGRDAVMIRKKNGGIITLGSDDAAGLYAAITDCMIKQRKVLDSC